MSLTTRVMIALVLGIAGGVAIASSGSPRLAQAAVAIEPLGTLWINAIRMTVIPLVVGSLIVGITSAPDAKSIGRVGRWAIVFFVVTLFAAAAYAALLAPFLIDRIPLDPAAVAAMKASSETAGSTAVQSAANVPTFTKWLVDLVPANPVKAAADGALLPLIIFTLMFGLALLTLPEERRTPVVAFFRGLGDAALTVVRWVLSLAPLGVFALALPLATRMGASAAGALAAFVATVIGITVSFALLVLYPIAVIGGRVSFMEFARASFPAQAVAFSSRSSLAALPAMIEAAKSRLGLPAEISGFFLPLAASTYRIAGALAQPTGVLFIARLYGVELTPTMLLGVVLTVVPTTFSVPGIPAGSIIVMVPVLISAGLPPAGIGVLLGIDAITDMFRTATNVTGDMAGAVVLGRRQRAPAPAALAVATEPAP
ncbi:MAG TPA: dicarboxylate/amino acid:cation symporter [Gemmatimonadaceae bacterium]|nr:dicarboxylate/amino acid:cation symporter [Gemmatimonadaceae bacterium]